MSRAKILLVPWALARANFPLAEHAFFGAERSAEIAKSFFMPIKVSIALVAVRQNSPEPQS
jgi:hypothetical protein